MGAKTAKDISGYEFDWLACDGAGHVGFFSTAGGGHAPEAFLRDTEAAATVARRITLKGLDFPGLKVIAGELIKTGSQKQDTTSEQVQ
ncbi:hypothetical protein D7W79_17330 [Corallococcus exercitus]|uniref:hypothetical protein n=1 Tax=Corallococcus exercitus TaxID=2316736 RepID=UPI000EA013F4|nr:hypothetical protein [Corallococcus exercitus]RKG76654.1 hypothetical protein D7W79_17330 [Corallococcus exercitus]